MAYLWTLWADLDESDVDTEVIGWNHLRPKTCVWRKYDEYIRECSLPTFAASREANCWGRSCRPVLLGSLRCPTINQSGAT